MLKDVVSKLHSGLLGMCTWGVVVLMLAIVAQVVCSFFDINPLLTFSDALPLVGKAVTLNSLLDMQWHLLAAIALLPAGLVWLQDRHVRVDFFYGTRTGRQKAWIDGAGHIFLTAPFLVLCLPATLKFVERAWTTDQGSTNDGLNDLWLVKAVLPMGLGLLAIVLIIDMVRIFRLASNR